MDEILLTDLYSTDSNFASDPKLVMKIKPLFTNPEYSLEGLMLKLQYFAHLMRSTNSLEKTLMLEKIKGRRGRGQ